MFFSKNISIDNNSHRSYTALTFGRPATDKARRETNHCMAKCASLFAWTYLTVRVRRSALLFIDLFAEHHQFAVYFPYACY